VVTDRKDVSTSAPVLPRGERLALDAMHDPSKELIVSIWIVRFRKRVRRICSSSLDWVTVTLPGRAVLG
jgi:hypothetical protein